MSRATPMLRQYLGIKEEYPDAILFFRMGDFYEMFFEDAQTAAKILGITLTARGTYMGRKVPMCGVPHHAAKAYIGRLVESGCKVAVCDQVEDPRAAKGVVKREVVRVVTPGSIVDERELSGEQNLYLAAVAGQAWSVPGDGAGSVPESFGLSYADLSTGEFRFTEVSSLSEVLDELGRIQPAELLLPAGSGLERHRDLGQYRIERIEDAIFDPRTAHTLLTEQLGGEGLEEHTCRSMPKGMSAAGAIVHYLHLTQKGSPRHIKELIGYRVGDAVVLDQSTCIHLELLRTMRRQSVRGSLFGVLDATVTPMGSRLLKRWVAYPLMDIQAIEARLAAVAWFKDHQELRDRIRQTLKTVYDIERLNGRVALGRANARDLLALKSSLHSLPCLKELLADSPSYLVADIEAALDPLGDVAGWIADAICEDPPVSVREGGMIREGYDPRLDELVALSRKGKDWIAEFAAREQKRVGIPSLKVGYNRVFGYYIEISKSNLHLVPPEYVRKQTLVNGERYITEDLKVREEQVLSAEEKRVALEYELFESLRERISRENQRIRRTAAHVAQLDVLAALAEVAEHNDYARPQVHSGTEIDIEEGRHPVVEKTVLEEPFVPNDIHLDGREQQILIITGPNMAGKSTVLRQTALTVLMAQMGSFVPAAKASIGIVDRIFTRVGASDDLARGLSTFMVEMTETAHILRHATPRSLVILDEIGRGTSTYDGLSIAWAVAEDLHDHAGKGVRTLFATHYHELTEMVAAKPRVKNFQIAVREWEDRVIFLRKLLPGGTSRSYGIQVARIAGVPERVLLRAQEILENLENGEIDATGRPRLARSKGAEDQPGDRQLPLFGRVEQDLIQWIRDLDTSTITPLQALVELDKIKTYVEGRGSRRQGATARTSGKAAA